MLLRSEGEGRRVLSRNADESSLKVTCHKDEMQHAHWSALSGNGGSCHLSFLVTSCIRVMLTHIFSF